MRRFLRLHKFSLILLFTGILFYASFGYDLLREDFIKLLTLYAGLFFISWKLMQIEKINFWFLAGTALIFRLIFIGALPNLSQDYFRFIWDGRMLLAGWNPYLHLPVDIIEMASAPIAQAEELYRGMGALSAENYTNYPPLNQIIFALAGLVAGKSILGSVVVIRLVVILADIGTLFLGKKLLEKMGLPGHRIFWYLLNPLVIVELTGNLHFEGVMVFFLIAALYLLYKHKWILSAIMFSASVLIKLLPLMFLPFMYYFFKMKREGSTSINFKKLLGYYAIVGGVVICSFLPFLSGDLISSYSSSIGLYFQKFEFNASIYYIIRWIGFEVKGYNIIATAGKVLPVIVMLIFAALIAFRKHSSPRALITTLLFAMTAYFLFATTLHPWYLVTPLFLSVFTPYRYMILWSFLVILSYYTYSTPEFREDLWLVAFQYIVVFGFFAYEIFKRRRGEPVGD